MIKKITKILQGDLVEYYCEGLTVIAIINTSNWFFKVKLLSAEGLNYEWAQSAILAAYTAKKNLELLTKQRKENSRY
tara:strand:+ start:209 stop:439 length:231 start_codon:yes stop_codon:yes gene_type:complete